jgi:hypothetical protein
MCMRCGKRTGGPRANEERCTCREEKEAACVAAGGHYPRQGQSGKLKLEQCSSCGFIKVLNPHVIKSGDHRDQKKKQK